jgi:hypothetical protein
MVKKAAARVNVCFTGAVKAQGKRNIGFRSFSFYFGCSHIFSFLP